MVYTVDTYPVGGHYPKVDWEEYTFPTPPVLKDFDDGLPIRDGPKAGVPVYGGVLPKVVRWDEPADNPPPDFDNRPTLNVSERAKQVIEAVEPGVHQFFPVDYIDRQDQLIESRYCSTFATAAILFIRPRVIWFSTSGEGGLSLHFMPTVGGSTFRLMSIAKRQRST